MANENEAQVTPQEEQEEDLTPETELAEDTTDWKAEAIKARRIASRYRNQAVKAKEAKKPDAAKTEVQSKSSSGELDYGQLAFLAQKGIESDEDVALAQEVMKQTGKSLKDVVASKYFQAELKERQEARQVEKATPSASRRSASSPQTEVDYWIKKGELPPADQVELRRAVVNAKMGKAKSPFYNGNG